MKYAVDLTVPFGPLRDYSVLNQTSAEPEIFFANPQDVSEEFKQWLDSQGLVMTYPPLIFYTPKGQQCGIHIDGDGITDRACINFIHGGIGSLMHWYKLLPGNDITEQTETQAGTPYTLYHPSQVEHVFSHAINQSSIVQIGVPHNVTNHTIEARWCMSCDISKKETPESGLTMGEALEIFKKWTL